MRGGYVQLGDVAARMVVGEGIDSSAAAGLLLGLPALAALSAGNLGGTMQLPPEVREVVIAADHDPVAPNGRRPGRHAAEAAARRWARDGVRVRIAMPDNEGTDFADVLISRWGTSHAG